MATPSPTRRARPPENYRFRYTLETCLMQARRRLHECNTPAVTVPTYLCAHRSHPSWATSRRPVPKSCWGGREAPMDTRISSLDIYLFLNVFFALLIDSFISSRLVWTALVLASQGRGGFLQQSGGRGERPDQHSKATVESDARRAVGHFNNC